jgi:hypothetical protein
MVTRVFIFGLLMLAAPLLRAGEVLDRIVATVNGHAILLSDWQDEVRYEAFIGGRKLQSVTAQDKKAALDRLTDRELLREQEEMAETVPISAEEIDKQLEAVKTDAAREGMPWGEVLAGYQLTEADIRNHIALELSELRFVDARLRPSIQVEPDEIAAYYRSHLSSSAGGQPISLQEATPKIRELLTQEKMNQELSTWLESLRSQAEIRTLPSDSSDSQGPAQ